MNRGHLGYIDQNGSRNRTFTSRYIRAVTQRGLLDGNASRTILDESRTSLRLSSIGDAESIQSFRTGMSQTRRRPSTKKSSSTGKSSETLSLKTQKNHNTSGPNTPVIEETSFINKATKEHNFEALKEGLSFALGTADSGANWFPVTPDPKSGSEKNRIGHQIISHKISHLLQTKGTRTRFS